MKKIIAIILGVLVLAMGLIGCASCKPEEPDPHEALYGVYKLVPLSEDWNSGIEVRNGGNKVYVESLPSNKVINRYPEYGVEINDFIIDLKETIGDTITITKDKIVFSEGNSNIAEFEYQHHTSYISFFEKADEIGFPLYSIDYEIFSSIIPPACQLEVSKSMWFSPEPDDGQPWRPDYTVYFYYLK